ncbi:AAA family ATPase, partial [Candidatus Bathyarchaeota archaeon]|nr:AAA family ATPase [Candidatus Bathyarchaeota archaeon]
KYLFSLDREGLDHQKCMIASGEFCLEGEYTRWRDSERIAVPFSGGQILFDSSGVLGQPFRYAGLQAPSKDFDASSLIYQFLLVVQQDLQGFFMVPAIRGASSPSYPLDSGPSEDLMDVLNPYQQAVKFSSTVVYNSPAIERKINKWISRITGIAIRARTIPDKRAAIEAFRKMDVNIVNEGFGSNQLVHLFAQIATTPQHALIGIEEPEVHLHPKAQSELAKVLIEIANEEKKNLILTTHSEHILYRFLLEVARGSLKPEDLAIYHFRLSDEGVTNVEELNVDKKGRLDKGIPDFFETDLGEFKDFLEALKA